MLRFEMLAIGRMTSSKLVRYLRDEKSVSENKAEKLHIEQKRPDVRRMHYLTTI